MNKSSNIMFSFSSKLWYDPRRVSSKTGEVSLYVQVIIDGLHDEFPLKLRWPATAIDLAKGKCLPRWKNDGVVSDYNLEVSSEIAKHTDILMTYRLKKKPIDIKKFAKELKVFDQRECFLAYFKSEIDRRFRKKEISQQTKKNHHSVRRLLMAFDPVCNYQDINLKWMKAFKTFLINREWAKGKFYKPGTIWAAVKSVKTYLTLAADEPLISVDESAKDFPNPKPNANTIYCNRDELRRLMILHRSGQLTNIERKVLSAFLFQCFTSLRISDVYRVDASWRLEPGYLDFIPAKNFKKQKWIHIPIMPMANHFITETKGQYFDLPTTQEFNRSLKDLAKMALINKPLKSHAGRHTFGYLYMTTVGNLKGLQEIMGHSKIETTERYAHLDDDYQTQSVIMIQSQFEDLILSRQRKPEIATAI